MFTRAFYLFLQKLSLVNTETGDGGVVLFCFLVYLFFISICFYADKTKRVSVPFLVFQNNILATAYDWTIDK